MREKTYFTGMDVLGADDLTGKAILIKIRNPAQLAQSQGAIASLAQGLAPMTIEGQVYSTVAKELAKGLKEKNVDAQITVVQPVGWKSTGGIGALGIIAIAVGTIGSGALLWRYMRAK